MNNRLKKLGYPLIIIGFVICYFSCSYSYKEGRLDMNMMMLGVGMLLLITGNILYSSTKAGHRSFLYRASTKRNFVRALKHICALICRKKKYSYTYKSSTKNLLTDLGTPFLYCGGVFLFVRNADLIMDLALRYIDLALRYKDYLDICVVAISSYSIGKFVYKMTKAERQSTE